ncbi:MAG TPA: hypothetical protein VFV86_10900 [Nitrososphaeraceae archaeon]|nr:hypothetical protein [Nitrososphaeraceae archaeon]
MSNEDVATTIGTATKDEEEENGEEYEEEFEIEIRTQKGSSIKVESSSYDKLDDLLNKAFDIYKRLEKEESGEVDEKLQYQ